MSNEPSSDPRKEPAPLTDKELLSLHGKEPLNDGGRDLRWVPTALLVLFSLLLCIGAVYLRRYAGGFSSYAYDEEHAAAGGSAAAKAVDMVAFGKKQYLSACVTCHQPTGAGLPGVYPQLAGSEWVNGSEEKLIRIVLFGLNGKVTVAGQTTNGTVAMPSFGKVPGGGYNWRDDQIAAVLTYIRQEWGNTAPAVSTKKVSEIRAKVNRDKPWTVEELDAVR